MADGSGGPGRDGATKGSAKDAARPQRAGEAATTRFGMEEGDNTDVPATGLDPDRQSPDKRE